MHSIVGAEWAPLIQEFEKARGAGWVVRSELGVGNSAAVFLVDSPNGPIALKLYKPEFFEGQNAAAERFRLSLQQGLQGHDCASLVQILETGEIGSSAFVLMEYVPWQTLDRVLGALQPRHIPDLMASIANAAIWLEAKGLVHRDIKPSNILVEPNFSRAKLVDLGVVRLADTDEGDLTDQGARKPFIATAQYSSPEYLFRLVEPSPTLWLGLTIYQLGAVLHDLLNAKPLFHEQVATENRYILAMAVLNSFPIFTPADYPPRWAALARRALGKDLDDRVSSVSLIDFCNLHRVDLDAIRGRLKLRSSNSGLARLAEIEYEQNRVHARAIADEVQQAFAHQLRNMGLERIRWVHSDPASAWAMLPIPATVELELATRIAITIASGVVEVRLGQSLHRAAEEGACNPSQLLWRGARDRLSVELTGDIIPQIEESVLVALDKAGSLAEVCTIEAMSLPMVLEGGP